jgi:alpha-L-glutamate ligase-like protein
VVGERSGERLVKSSGLEITFDDLEFHVCNILSGMYSLGGHPDAAMIEYRVAFDPLFEDIAYRGVPDIRTLVFRGVSVMAMVRLPTRASDGRANLHQGAVGGRDRPRERPHHERGVSQPPGRCALPTPRHALAGLQIPNWTRLLDLAARCYDLTSLGYLGVDVVLDAHYGPLMLELNARPGISIQIANRAGLRGRLQAAEHWLDSLSELPKVEERVRSPRDPLRDCVSAAANQEDRYALEPNYHHRRLVAALDRSRASHATRRVPRRRRARRSTTRQRAFRKGSRS